MPRGVRAVAMQQWLPRWWPVSLVYRWAEFNIVVLRSENVWELCKGSIITPAHSTVASRYNSWQPFSIITIVTWLGDWFGSFEYGCAHTRAFQECFSDCSGDVYWWCLFVARILRIHRATGWTIRVLSGDQRIQHVFKVYGGSIDVMCPHIGEDGYFVVR